METQEANTYACGCKFVWEMPENKIIFREICKDCKSGKNNTQRGDRWRDALNI